MYLYIHIPFCESKCKYCKFSSTSKKDIFFIKKYLLNLNKEINDFKYFGEQALKSIYFGGGTPSTLSSKELQQIITTIKNNTRFSPDIEITLETTPQNITKQNLLDWYKIGINRISFGVQTLNEKSLKEIGRQTKKQIFSALDLLSQSKIKNISLDFIIGLPYVKKGEISKDIIFLLQKYPFIKHISAYMLENHNYPKNWKNISILESDFSQEYQEIVKTLADYKLYKYEISNFAKTGFEAKHNQAYWNHSELAGFGLSAHGYINGKRYENPDKFSDYYSGKKTFEKLSKQQKNIEKIIFALRTKGLNKTLIKFLDQKGLTQMLKLGYLEKTEDKLVLPLSKTVLLDYILTKII